MTDARDVHDTTDPSEGIALDTKFVRAVEDWLLTASGVLVLTQTQTGCGVTHMLHRLQAKHESSLVYVNISDSHASKRTVLGQKKVILVDPPDGFFVDPAKTARIAQVIESPRLPVVIAGFRRRTVVAKLQALLRKSAGPVVRLDVPPLDDDRAIAILRRAADTMHSAMDVEQAWHATHDLRHCLESMASGTGVREILPDGTEGLRAVLQQTQRSFGDRVRIAEGDSTIMVDGAFENYVHGIRDIEDAVGVMELLEEADLLEATSYQTPTFDPSGLTAALVAGVATNNVHVTRKIQTFGTVWARSNHRIVKQKQLAKLGRHGVDVDSAAYIRSMALTSPDELRRVVDTYGADDTWTIMKLWPPCGKKLSRKRFKSCLQASSPNEQPEDTTPLVSR